MNIEDFMILLRYHRGQLVEPPTVVTMGEHDFDELRETMLASNANLVLCKDGEPWYETGKHLTKLGIQYFFLNGVLVLRARSHSIGIQVL